MKFSKKKGDALFPNSGYSLPVYQSAPSGSPGAPPKKEKTACGGLPLFFSSFLPLRICPVLPLFCVFLPACLQCLLKNSRTFGARLD